MQDGTSQNGGLLSQEEYAERIGVSPSWVSKATRQGKVVDGEYYPARDAVVDEDESLIGYRDPTKGAVPQSAPSSNALPDRVLDPAPRGGLGSSTSRQNGSLSGSAGLGDWVSGNRVRGNGTPNESSASSGQQAGTDRKKQGEPNGTSRATPNPSLVSQRNGQGTAPVQTELEGAAGSLATAVAQDQGALRGALRLGGAAGGAVFLCHLADRNLLSAFAGATIGFGIIEYSLHLARQ
jgi:hypothetical protein